MTAILWVEFWWWLHRRADYVLRIDHDKKKCLTIVSYRKILRDADLWSDRMLFNHLAYAAMRCSDQGLSLCSSCFPQLR
jgi:hypothetical protein